MKKIHPMFALLALAGLLACVAGCGDGGKSPTAKPAPAPMRDDGTADVEKGMTALSHQDPKAAAANFQIAADKCPSNFEAQIQLALVRTALGEVKAADAAAAAACELRPDSAEARLAEGQVAYLKKDYLRALADFDAVAAAKSLPAALRSEAMAARGVVEYARNQFDEARVSFLRAKRLNRRNAAAYYHLGLLFRNVYHFNEAAIEQFDIANRILDARDPRAKKVARDILPQLRNLLVKAAATRLGQVKRDTAKAEKIYAEGEKLQKRKFIRDSIKKYSEAFAVDPFLDKAAIKVAYLTALNKKREADVDTALKMYRAAIDLRPEMIDYYLDAARLAYNNRRWSVAAEIMNRAIAHDPNNRNGLDLLIAALRKCGKTAQAELWQGYRAEIVK